MSKYYTTVEITNEQFIGTVFEATTNRQVYKTQPQATQLEAMRRVDMFLATEVAPPEDAATPVNTPVITNTYVSPQPGAPTRRCCGR